MKNNGKKESLSSNQQKAIPLVASGLTDLEVAEAVSVTRQTVSKWKNQHTLFIQELERYRLQLWRSYGDCIRALIPKAVKVLKESLESENHKVRLDAAKTILRTVKPAPINIPEDDLATEPEQQLWIMDL